MITSVARSGQLAGSLVATSQAVPSAMRQIIPGFVQTAKQIVVQAAPEAHTNFTLSKLMPRAAVGLNQRISNGIGATSQVRFAHSDVQVPDFTAYRRDGTKDPNKSSAASDDSRKSFSYIMMAGGAIGTAYATKSLVGEFVTSMSASADVLALAKIEIKLSDIPEGKSATFKWRNKPLFVRHRTGEEIAKEEAVDVSSLRDQQHDSERVQKPEWLILLGVCTHLGCVPIDGLGDYGGYYCPCHGSHYDASGRIRKGPAPLNLEIPEYEFVDDDNVIVG